MYNCFHLLAFLSVLKVSVDISATYVALKTARYIRPSRWQIDLNPLYPGTILHVYFLSPNPLVAVFTLGMWCQIWVTFAKFT